MTAVSATCVMMAYEGFWLKQTASYITGVSIAVALFSIHLIFLIRRNTRREHY